MPLNPKIAGAQEFGVLPASTVVIAGKAPTESLNGSPSRLSPVSWPAVVPVMSAVNALKGEVNRGSHALLCFYPHFSTVAMDDAFHRGQSYP